MVKELIGISKTDWNSKETSWEYEKDEIVSCQAKLNSSRVVECFDFYYKDACSKVERTLELEENIEKAYSSIYDQPDESSSINKKKYNPLFQS